MAQYIVYKDGYHNGYRGSKDRLTRYNTMAEARAQAIKLWKKSGNTLTVYNIDKASINPDYHPYQASYYPRKWMYDRIGWVECRHDGDGKYRYYYRSWTRDLDGKTARFKKTMHKYAAMIEIAENGQTIKKSLNPAVASAYNRKKKDLPFGL